MKWLLILVSAGYVNIATAQLNSYIADGAAYTKHTVKKSEGAYGIAKVYHIDFSELLKANALEKNASLKEGMELRIPLSGHLKMSCSGDSCMPVMYTVQQSEGLYRIGKNHGNIKIAELKTLNHLTGEAVAVGTKLLVGYLLVSPGEIIVTEQVDTINTKANSLPVVSKNKPVTVEKKEEVTGPLHNVTQPGTKKLAGDTGMLTYKGKGFFEPAYKPGNVEKTLTAAGFKSESGWTDGKFYVLVDGIEQGAILRLKNMNTGNFIYAKVVGTLPQVKHADNIKIRISSAGMIALELFYDEPYDVQVSF